MKKTFKMEKIVAVSALAVTLLAGGAQTFAAEVGTGKTDAKVGFKNDGSVTPPPGTLTGNLDLIYYPKSFDFGTAHTASASEVIYPEVDAATQAKYAVVRDARIANTVASSPWKLTAKASELKDNSTVLKNATTYASYELGHTTPMELKSYQSVSGTDSEAPETAGAIGVAANLPMGSTVSVNPTVSIPANGANSPTVTVMQTGLNTVDGKYALEMYDISLKVPAGAALAGKQYKGTITWMLEDSL